MRAVSTDPATVWFELYTLSTRYSHALDDGDVRAAVAMFEPDGVFDPAVGTYSQGHSQLLDYFGAQQSEPEWLPYLGGQHLVSNVLVQSTSDDEATVQCDFMYVVPTEDGPVVSLLGRYNDVVRWTGAEWLYVRRKVTANPCAREPKKFV